MLYIFYDRFNTCNIGVYFRPVADNTGDDGKKKDARFRSRPLYDIPYMFEAREFLRKKLIGKKVNFRPMLYIFFMEVNMIENNQ